MKNLVLIFILLGTMPLFFACQNKSAQQSSNQPEEEVDTPRTIIQIKDSTIYGKTTDCGMSTLALILDKGDTMYVERTSEVYGDGIIYGDLILDNYFCMITRENNQSLKFAINLTQLNKFVKDYKIINGQIILRGSNPEMADTVSILSLSADKLVISSKHGQKTLKPRF